MTICFEVKGTPIQQGSKSIMPGNRLIDQNDQKLRPWRRTVATHARAARGAQPRFEGAVCVVLVFSFKRPKSVSAWKRPFMTVKPDLDKLIRAVLDSCTDGGIWKDDAQVVTLQASKVYADQTLGVTVSVEKVRL